MSECASCGKELPPDARFCPACGVAVEAPLPTEERKLATVLFADLVGSTQLGEQDPERTRVLLDRFYDAMAAEIEAAGGTVEKFAGDAVMAAFGAPAALEDHAERALHAALGMQRRLDAPLELRIGVNTGEVVVGRPREGSSFVTGDAVNVAARLEQAAGPGEILAGERTVAAARGAFEFDNAKTFEAKGKADGVVGRRLVRALTLMRPRGVGGLREAFVGRETEIDLLGATYRRVVERGEPHLVTIMGDAGVGKTRLVRELWQLLGNDSAEPMRRTGRCLSYGRGITYWPLGEILKEHFGILESDASEAVLARLGERRILGLALGFEVAPDLHPLVAREQLHEAVVSFLDDLATERPVVLLVEDLHWAEEELLDLVDRVLREVNGPLFLIATSRPEMLDIRPAWGGGKRNVTLLGLEPLSASQTEQMVAELLAADLPGPVRAALVERTGGNPFFVEELVATLIDRGVLERTNGVWLAHELPEGFEIPDSVQAVLAARIDLLPVTEKAALQAASLIGRVFWSGPVRLLLEGGEPDFELLEDRDFIRRRPGSSMPGEREFAVKHALTREVAYATLPKARRARLHAAFAQWLERTDRTGDEHAALLGHHYAEAVRPEDVDLAWTGDEGELGRLRAKAVEWLRRAAELATARYELDEAIALLRRALELEDDPQAQARLWHVLGRSYALKYDGPRFWDAMEKAIERCGDDRLRADLYADLALDTAGRGGMFPVQPSVDVVEGWAERALELAEAGSPAATKALLARSHWRRARGISSGLPEAVEAEALADQLGDPDLRGLARNQGVLSLVVQGNYDEALAWVECAHELIDEVRDPDIEADIHAIAAVPSLALGRFEDARLFVARHEEVASKLTPHHRVHGVAVSAELEELAGNWPAIGRLEGMARERVTANLATPCIRNARTVLLCAIAAEYAGDRERSAKLEDWAREVELEGFGSVLSGPELRLALARGDLEALERLIDRDAAPTAATWFRFSAAISRLDALVALGNREEVEREAPPLVRPATLLEPFALRALGQVREDEESIRQALAGFEAMGLDWYATETRRLLEA